MDFRPGLNGFFAIDDFRFESTSAPVPEPVTMILFGTGLAGLVCVARKRKQGKKSVLVQ
jgi:hypothetical protein